MITTATVARAGDVVDPQVTIRVVGAVGAGDVHMSDGRFGALGLDAALEGVYWLGAIGIGLRVGHSVLAPFSPSTADAELVHWNESVEPALVMRTPVARFGVGTLSLQGSVGLGIVDVRTMDLSGIHGHEEHTTGSAVEVASETRFAASLAGAAALQLSWFELSLGLRAEANRAGDWMIGPQLGVGASF